MQTQQFHVVCWGAGRAPSSDKRRETSDERRAMMPPDPWRAGAYFASCILTLRDDMEALAERYNRWYAKAHPRPLCIDGSAYRSRTRARVRRG